MSTLDAVGYVVTAVILITVFVWVWVYVIRPSRRKAWVKANGRSVPAKVVAITPDGNPLGRGEKAMQKMVLMVEVQPVGERPFQKTIRELLYLTDIAKLTPDIMITLRCDPHDSQRVTLPSDWANLQN
jgi:hypothetical protein